MAAVRGFLAIIAGVLVAGIIGAAYDYIRPDFIPNPMEYKFAWPWFFAVPGAIAALIAVMLYSLWQGSTTAGKERPAKPAKVKAAGSKSPSTSGFSTSSEVPGMPTFDVNKLKADSANKEQIKK